MEDAKIVELYWTRSEDAIAETAAKYGGYCHAIARNILGNADDAEEAVNSAYLGAWNSIPPHRPAVLSAYLGKLTRRIAIKAWQATHAEKRGGGETAAALDELADCIPSDSRVEQTVEAAELHRLIADFVRRLPQTERNVFVRRYWYLDSIADLCARFGFSQSKVKSMLSRTRNKLFLYLSKEGVFE